MRPEGNDKKNCQGPWYSAFPSIIPSTCIENILNTFILNHFNHWFSHRNGFNPCQIACSCQQMSSTVPKFSVSPSIFTWDHGTTGSNSWWSVMFHWCSPKNCLKTTCFLGMAREFWSQFHNVRSFFQMNFSYQPIKNRDEKPRDLSKALAIRPPTFGSRSEKDTIAILAENFHECGCFSAQSMGNNHACRRITERPPWGTSHPGVQQDAADGH